MRKHGICQCCLYFFKQIKTFLSQSIHLYVSFVFTIATSVFKAYFRQFFTCQNFSQFNEISIRKQENEKNHIGARSIQTQFIKIKYSFHCLLFFFFALYKSCTVADLFSLHFKRNHLCCQKVQLFSLTQVKKLFKQFINTCFGS